MEGYMSVSETADYLGKSKPEVHRLIRAGLLEAEKLGNAYAIPIESAESRKLSNPGPGNRSGKARVPKQEE